MPHVFVHKAHHQVHAARGLQQRAKGGVAGHRLARHVGYQVEQGIACQRQLGEHQQLHALAGGLLNIFQVVSRLAAHRRAWF